MYECESLLLKLKLHCHTVPKERKRKQTPSLSTLKALPRLSSMGSIQGKYRYGVRKWLRNGEKKCLENVNEYTTWIAEAFFKIQSHNRKSPNSKMNHSLLIPVMISNKILKQETHPNTKIQN